MKKYKSNYVFTFSFIMCNLFLSFFPGLFLMWILLNPTEPEGILYLLLSYIGFIAFFIVGGNLLHFFISLFTKHTIYIDEDTITIKGKKIYTQSMKLEDVSHVLFDQGTIRKYGGGTPCSITLYDMTYSQVLTVNNPSFLMICELQKRLKHATFKFNNYKWYIIWCGIITAFMLPIGLSGLLLG